MRRLAVALMVVVGTLVLLVALHLALIEIGREVVVLRTPDGEGNWQETRLWVVDYDGALWVHSEGPAWHQRFAGDPVVELRRHGRVQRYRATPDADAHPAIDALLREKYGIADRWVRFIAPCNDATLPVRLSLVSGAPDDARSTID